MHTGHEGQTTWQVELYNVYRIQSSNGHRNSIGGVGVIYSHACHPDNQLLLSPYTGLPTDEYLG